MEKFNSHFVFNQQQRNGILFLLFLISGLLCTYLFVDFNEEKLMDTSSKEIIDLRNELDSLRVLELESRRPKAYPFNPNFISDFKGYTLGMSAEELNRLNKYRSEEKWISSIQDFKNVTKISDSLLNEISPYFKFPDWIAKPRTKKGNTKITTKSYKEKKDLNTVSETELQKIKGIGEKLSDRILKYREKLGGFSADSQVYTIYGLNEQVVERIFMEFTVKTPKEIVKMDLHNISASDIATLPGISFDLAKKIWEFRILRGSIKDFSELKKIEGMTQRKLEVIQLYLAFE